MTGCVCLKWGHLTTSYISISNFSYPLYCLCKWWRWWWRWRWNVTWHIVYDVHEEKFAYWLWHLTQQQTTTQHAKRAREDYYYCFYLLFGGTSLACWIFPATCHRYGARKPILRLPIVPYDPHSAILRAVHASGRPVGVTVRLSSSMQLYRMLPHIWRTNRHKINQQKYLRYFIYCLVCLSFRLKLNISVTKLGGGTTTDITRKTENRIDALCCCRRCCRFI